MAVKSLRKQTDPDQGDTSLSAVNLNRALTFPLSISLTYDWLQRTQARPPCNDALCWGVITADNIRLQHSLQVRLRERDWLLHFLCAVARLVPVCKSVGPLSEAGTVSEPASDCSLAAFVRKTENHCTHSGWRARTSNAPTPTRLTPPFLNSTGPTNLMAGSRGPASRLWPQSVYKA